MKKNPYEIVKTRHITEKAVMLQELKNSESNPSVKACKDPKYVFIVDNRANKQEIAWAVEEIYRKRGIKVVKVNTLRKKGKQRRVRGRLGMTSSLKKAIVTLQQNDSLDEV